MRLSSDFIEFQWLHQESSFREALQATLNPSNQLLKKHFSSKQLARPVLPRDLSRLPLDLVNHLRINPEYQGPAIQILRETPLYLAIHKPAGIHSHPHQYSDKNTVLNFLAQQNLWAPLVVNMENYDRGLLYRLDQETSGVMLLAKTEQILHVTRQNFSTQMKKKYYWAVVEGSFELPALQTHYFKAAGAKGSKQKVFDQAAPETTLGVMSVVKVGEGQGKSLLLINLKTGLRHQIRAQLSHLGFPIVGDELYGGAKEERLFLHAYRYEWIEVVEDPHADLFERFFDLNSALQMSYNVLGRF